MIASKIVKKVPGESPNNLKDKQGHIDNLEKLSVLALTEILERQNKLLQDRFTNLTADSITRRVFIKKLPDRGERIHNLKDKLEDELKKRNELSDVCEVMSGLTVNGKELSEKLEWCGKNKENLSSMNGNHHFSDDELDPIKILATHSGAGFHQKEIITEKEPEPLIKPSDVENDEDFSSEPYVKPLCDKFDSTKPKERYLPFKTLVNEKQLKNIKVREVTAATPPISKLASVKQVSLQESLLLQAQQAQHLREVQMKHAAERLRDKGNIIIGDVLPPPETTAHYRESPPSDSEEEIIDEDAKEEPGGVTFPLANS